MGVIADSERRGLMIVLSSPSGAGKTTISRALLERNSDVTLSISVTTRPPRKGEVDGVDYYFIDQERFEEMIRNDELLEYALVFDFHYGTPREYVLDTLDRGTDVLFDIDWQGTQQLRLNSRDDMASIFLLPPSLGELERRLRQRAQDPEEIVQKRMEKAPEEMSHWAEYDYVLVNEDLEECIDVVQKIIEVERLKRTRRPWLTDFVRKLRTS